MKGRRALLTLARAAIESSFTKKEVNLEQYQHYDATQGVFVTLTKNGDLRGCISYPVSEYPLYKGVILAAKNAAFKDPRFPPLEMEELGAIRIEVTILTQPERVKVNEPSEYLTKLKVGRDGLLIKEGYRTGLLLPQVPVEYGWNIETYLEQLCKKAGLPQDAWKTKRVTIERFEGEVISE
jgi:AmmeMemoRadiSam system protein A